MAAPTTPGGNGDLPAPDSWAEDFPRIDSPVQTPIRAAQAGVGNQFVVTLVKKGTPGALNQFLARDGTWVNFASTELNAWGSIIGDITNQTDLWEALQARPEATDLAPVAFSGVYNDLTGKPTLGTVAQINLNGLTSYFLRGDGQWVIPTDVNAQWGNISGDINAQTDLTNALNLKAPLANPTFTGLVQAPTRAVDDNSTGVATTAWFFGQAFDGAPVMDGVAASGDSLRWARGNHRHPTDTSRAPLDSPNFSGIPTAPTPGAADDSTRIATTAWVRSIASLPDAPSDGQMYVRQNGNWVAIEVGARWDNDGTP